MIRPAVHRLGISLGVLRRPFDVHWTSLRQFLSLTADRILRFLSPAPLYPLTSQQLNDGRDEFLRSIDKSAVGALASRFHHHKECVVSDDVRHGSYNVCLFVEFPSDGTRWVVRVPMSSSVSDCWAKVQSEVATMQFVQRNTTIPVPKIHAYGKGERLTNNKHTTQTFIIMDHLPGKPLEIDTLYLSAKDRRNRFFAHLADILAQLQGLQFPRTGSLYPDGKDGKQPVIGSSLYLVENDLQVHLQTRRQPPPALTSTAEVVQHHFNVLSDFVDQPSTDAVVDEEQELIFATDGLAELLPEFCSPLTRPQSLFSLCHGDLRCDNILVDDEIRIQGIIDWEWATILPQQLCTPPLWLCGHDPGLEESIRDTIFDDFQRAVPVDHEYNACLEFWKQERFRLPIAQILRRPDYLVSIYWNHIYPMLHEEPFQLVSLEYFASEDKKRDVERRMKASECYTDYLKQRGLYVVDEEREKRREWLKTMDEMLDSIQHDLKNGVQLSSTSQPALR